MTSFLKRAVSALNAWLGLPAAPRHDPPMTPAHGWLLPPAAVLRARRATAGKRVPDAAKLA
jgi:hypothetical protein